MRSAVGIPFLKGGEGVNRLIFLSLAWLGLGGCAVQTIALHDHRPAGLPVAVELSATPFFAQTNYQCGPAALATALGAIGIEVAPQTLANQVFLPARAGTLQTEMQSGARRQGGVATVIPGTLEALLREVASGHVVVVLQNLGLSFAPQWHYAVVVGYDLGRSKIVMRSGVKQREQMRLRTFEHTWKRSGYWAIVITPPGQWPKTANEPAVVDAAIGFERSAPTAQAMRVYASAHELWPDNLSLAMGLGNTTYAAGHKSLAAGIFRTAAQQHRSAPAWINLSKTLLELGEPHDALRAAREAVALNAPLWQVQAQQALSESELATHVQQ